MDSIIDQFKMYRFSHPNLSQCWIAYLELKKRHYDAGHHDENLSNHCFQVLDLLANGSADLPHDDIVRLLLYYNSTI